MPAPLLASAAPASARTSIQRTRRAALWALLVGAAFVFVPTTPAAPWTTSGNLGQVRAYHTTTVLPNGKLLTVGGIRNGFVALASAELYDPTSGTWTATGSLAAVRTRHAAVLLPTGQVLILGGTNESAALTTTELYDPAAGVFVPGPALPAPLAGDEVLPVLLPNGKVYCLNGSAAALYDPAANTWSPAAASLLNHFGATLTLLANGKLLLAGGRVGNAYANYCEIYDPAANSWSLAADMLTGRAYHAATRLLDGRVLVTAGYSGTTPSAVAIKKAELYDPAADTWTAAPDLATIRLSHGAILQPNGTVLVAGGLTTTNNNAVLTTETYTPGAGSWTPGSSMSFGHANGTMTLLQNGRIALVGGQTGGNPVAATEITDPAVTGSALTGTLTARADHTTTALPNGRILVAGGRVGSTALNSAMLYDPLAGTWTATGNLNTARVFHTATLLRNGHVLVAGGTDGGAGNLQSSETYDPATGAWTNAGNLLLTTGFHSAVSLTNGKVLVTGGWSGSFLQNHGQIYDPTTRAWTATANNLGTARSLHASVLLPNGKVLVIGGQASGVAPGAWFNGTEVYDPATNQFSATGNLNVGRDRPSASLLRDGRVFVVGGGTATGATNAAEIYNPATGTWTSTTAAGIARTGVGTTLTLPGGKVLVAGGAGNSGNVVYAETYDATTASWNSVANLTSGHALAHLTLLPTGRGFLASGVDTNAETMDALGAAATAQPKIASASVNAAGQLVLTGTGFRGKTGGAAHVQDSPADAPAVWLRWLDNGQMLSLAPMRNANSFTDTAFTSMPFVPLRPGPVQIVAFVNGVPSAPATTGSGVSFLNLPATPSTTGSAATLVTSTTARLNATVTANGQPTQVVFHYSTHPNFAANLRITAPQSFAGTVSNQALSQNVSGLTPGTTHYFRAVASGTGGAAYSATFSFNALANAAPTASNPTVAANTGDAKSVAASALGTDPEGDTLTVTAASTGNANLTNFAFTAAGVTFTPALNFVGSATFNYTINDGNGHPVSGTATVNVTDNKPPTGTAIAGGPTGTVSDTTAAFTFSATDNVGVTAWRVTLDGVPQGDLATAAFQVANLAAGPHTLTVAARDAAGNQDGAPATRSWTVSVPPVLSQITILPPANFDAAANKWAGLSGQQIRVGHTATRLPDGRVLVVGGRLPDGATTSVEIFNAAATSSAAGPSMTHARDNHTATLLADGRVLVVGGRVGNQSIGTCEIFDPATNAWTDTAEISPRDGHTATRLADGRVLIVGGKYITAYPTFADSAHLFDPVAAAWTAVGPPSNSQAARGGHTATLLSNGDVLIVGGLSPIGPVEAGAVYRPSTQTWTNSGTLNQLRLRHTATLLPNGRVLIAGGDGPSGLLSSAELYTPAADPTQASFTPTTGAAAGRSEHAAVLLTNGSVAVLGGTNFSDQLASVEMYEPVSARWIALPGMGAVRNLFQVVTLQNGDILAISGSGTPGAERYRPGQHLFRGAGSAMSLSFLSSKAVPNVVVTAAGQSLSPSGTQAIVATGTLQTGAPQGLADLSITVTDTDGNVVTVTETTDGSRWIVDTVAPLVVPPPNVIAHATTPAGGVAVFPPATASDASGIVGPIQYTQVSGSFFANGVTQMLARATDAAGNEGQAAFTVTIVPLTPLEGWRYEHFGDAADNGSGADLADPDGDGLPNRLEFAFGTGPNSALGSGALQFAGTFAAAALLAPGQPIVRAEGSDRRALFVRRTDHAAAGLIYRVQFSADLATWEDSPSTPTSLSTAGAVELVNVPFPATVGGSPTRFFRVAVQLMP